MNRLLESRQKRIDLQEAQIKEMKEKNISLQQQVDVLELKVIKDKQNVLKTQKLYINKNSFNDFFSSTSYYDFVIDRFIRVTQNLKSSLS